jgi:trigger factor
VLEKLIPEQYNAALREASLKPVAMPVLEEKFEFKRASPLSLSFIIEVLPEIGDIRYDNLSVKDIPFTVEDSDIDEMIRRLQDRKAIFETADQEAGMDDLVTFEHVDSEIAGDKSARSVKELVSKMGNEIFPPDIMQKVLGKKKGDIIEFTTTFDETKPKELAGKTVNIKVKIGEVKKKTLPPVDDEFAKDIGYENLADLREKVREKIHTAKKDHIQKIQKSEIIRKIMAEYNFEVPESLLNREIEAITMEKSVSAKDDAVYTDSVTEIMESDKEPGTADKTAGTENSEVELKGKATRNVQASLIIDAIGKKEGVTVADTEVDDRIAIVAKRLSSTPEVVRNFYMYKEGSLESLRHSIFEEKVLDLLLSRATIEKGD